jgi:hypothetical protein
MDSSTGSGFPAAPADEPAGDSGDQAQRLQMAEEREAIEAALAGHPRGDDRITDRAAEVDLLEGQDLPGGSIEDEASDDPVFGGGEGASDSLEHEARELASSDEGPAEDPSDNTD